MKGIGSILMTTFVLIGLIGCSSESRKVTLHQAGVYKGAKTPCWPMNATETDRSLQISPNRSLIRGGVMARQKVKRTFGLLGYGHPFPSPDWRDYYTGRP